MEISTHKGSSTQVEAKQAGESQSTTLEVGGMNCASCVQRVERGLQKLEGVENAVVNLSTEEALVEYDSDPSPSPS